MAVAPPAYDPSVSVSATLHRLGGQRRALAGTIDAYDVIAETYAARFDGVDLVGHRRRFLGGLPTPLVLDAGCGAGRDCRLFSADRVDAIGIDLSAGMLAAASSRTRAPLVRGDVRHLPYRPATFGGVWSCAVLVHLTRGEFASALQDWHGALVNDGALFISVRDGVGHEIRHEQPGVQRWFRFYRSDEVIDSLDRAGFAIESAEVEPGLVGGTWINVHARKRPC